LNTLSAGSSGAGAAPMESRAAAGMARAAAAARERGGGSWGSGQFGASKHQLANTHLRPTGNRGWRGTAAEVLAPERGGGR